MKQEPMPEFPKRVYVRREGEGDDAYWALHEDPADADEDEGEIFAVYELQSVKRQVVTRELKDL